MFPNPTLYEINTRVWIKRFGSNISLHKIPFDYFEMLAAKGINLVWLMGVWKNSPELVRKYCFEPDLVQAYSKSLRDWKEDDIIGSPYAITGYEINPILGKSADIKHLKEKLNKIGVKLILDFIPNHLSAETPLIKTNPGIFLQADQEVFGRDSHTYYKPEADPTKIFAHGRDPLFPAWQDTIQINHFSQEAREFAVNSLLKLAEMCDGVRCDMAMLPLNNVFHNTWLGIINKYGIKKPEEEFWTVAIKKVKENYPDFIFIAEAYWDLEWDLQNLGFDFTYDKRLTDRLAYDDILGVKAHLQADKNYHKKCVRFIENHDEQRAVVRFGKEKSMAAAVVMSTLPGMKFFFDGQFEGKKVKLPVQLGREPIDNGYKNMSKFYDKLLEIINADIFKMGEWILTEPLEVHPDDKTYENFFAWKWLLGNQMRIIVVNYSNELSHCRIKLDIKSTKDEVTFIDLLNDSNYKRTISECNNPGLYIELNQYGSHIFSIEI